MLIGNNATHQLFVSDYNEQNSLLQTSIARLSSGQRMIAPGEAPADLGISERFRAQVRNSEEAGRVIQNAINMFSSTDSWLQEVHSMLERMSELAIAAADGSKNNGDRKNLDLEFQQLKQEIARISENGKYNGMQVNSNSSVAVYNFTQGTITYSQSDGTETTNLSMNLSTGNTASNGLAYNFENAAGTSVGEFMFSPDGQYLIYVAQDSNSGATAGETLVRLDLDSDTVTLGAALQTASTTAVDFSPTFVTDDQDRVWVSNPSAAGTYRIDLLKVEDMTFDTGGNGATNTWSGSPTNLARGEFAVSGTDLYYFDSNDNYVRQNMFNQSDTQVLITDITDTSAGGLDIQSGDQLEVSRDGLYLAWEDGTAGTINIVNTQTGKRASILHNGGGAAGSVADFGFDGNNRIYWTSSAAANADNTLNKAKILYGDTPTITDVQKVRVGNLGMFGQENTTGVEGKGLSVGHGSPRSSYKFQVGPDEGMSISMKVADVELVDLGLSDQDVLSMENAVEAVSTVANAIDKISNQRAVIGSQVSRMNFTFAANDAYGNNIAQAESRIRDVDFASESAKLVQSQIQVQAAASMLAQANSAKQIVLSLIQ